MPQPSAARSAGVTEADLRAMMVAIAQERDRAAFARLFAHFAPKLKAYGMRAGADPHTAEEIAQEAMVAVWRKAASFNPAKASVSTWLFTIVRNKRIDMLRREGRPDLREEDFLHLEQPVETQDETYEANETGAVLADRIAGLPDDQALVIKKAFYEDKSHRAIAEELGLPLGTVKSRIRLALTRLKTTLPDS
ncbi:hypothetical protein CCR85_08670 [Rhodothalassium salexigens]|nr:sigma-70 family RNA polymerase sigma factor [Rhodothalassium salexigens]MBB4211213.1 RNA polymerase sigma-70 factor (ECF subfamily) [Rhodothalassium salexigens DSM 2132]MBK1637552.1 hypothetical protein [Rhodothalassium salexigens DSM 2132]MBK5911559.1 hypothetical protein [Rhodothalassium salexigens]